MDDFYEKTVLLYWRCFSHKGVKIWSEKRLSPFSERANPSTNALTATLICSGRFGQAVTISARSEGSFSSRLLSARRGSTKTEKVEQLSRRESVKGVKKAGKRERFQI